MSVPGLFVVGTDTGVGKTFVAAAIAHALVAEGRQVGVLKPAATGATLVSDGWVCDDAEQLVTALGREVPRSRVVPFVYKEPLAPSVAARRAGAPLMPERVETAVGEALSWWAKRADVMIVEGVGGLLCPLAEGTTVADLAVTLDFPLVIVARRGLGTLNHTLLTVEAAARRGLRIAGLVLNGAEATDNPVAEATNAAELARRLDGVPILAELPHGCDATTASRRLQPLDWYSRSSRPRLASAVSANGA